MKINKYGKVALRDKSKQAENIKVHRQLSTQFSPLSHLQIYEQYSRKNSKQGKLTSTIYTSPSSYQSSQIVSKQQSRQKNTKGKGYPGKLVLMKKKNKKKRMNSDEKICQKQNKSTQIESIIAEQYKITKWKNKILKEFIVTSRGQNQQKHTLNFLQKSLQHYCDKKQQPSKSFFGYLLADGAYDPHKKTTLLGTNRILILDWIYLISSTILLNRETVHLAIHYLDSFFSPKDLKELEKISPNEAQQKIHLYAASALLLSVKQQERQSQVIYFSTVCLSEKIQLVKQQMIECEKQILIKLNFRLKSNTLSFWIDYFSMKWDSFIESPQGQSILKQTNLGNIGKMVLRSSSGDCYRIYRQLVELSDVCLMFGDYVVFQKCKLALGCIYLVIRIQYEKMGKQEENEDYYKNYHKSFMKKATPIFKDPLRINQIFNSFLTEVCQFQITEIIPCIKFVANFLNLDFCYTVDERAIQQTQSYEAFIRKMSYSYSMKDYSLMKIF